MTDRELLELAAKAVGYGLPGPDDHDEIGRQELDGLWVKFPWGWGWWRPLFSDADALRLAVKLRIRLQTPVEWYQNNTDHFYCSAAWVDAEGYEEWESVDFKLSEGGDPYAATRRAIVCAAAAIAKATHKEQT